MLFRVIVSPFWETLSTFTMRHEPEMACAPFGPGMVRVKMILSIIDWPFQEVLTIESATNRKLDSVFYAIANMTWVMDRKTGDVTYRLDGRDAFIDVGENIHLIDSREVTLAASLKVGQQKFGSYLHVTGTDQLKREIATAAAKHGLNVRFTEDRMNQCLKIDQKRYRPRSYSLER